MSLICFNVSAEPADVVRQAMLMGTTLRIEVSAADRGAALATSERLLRALERTEARLSSWRPDSELSRLNASSPQTPHALSPELERDLRLARELWQLSQGGFDPAIGALVDTWGLRSGGRQPSQQQLEAALAASGLQLLELSPGHARRLHPELWLDAGGFGKGVGLDAGLAELPASPAQAATLSLGGQLALWSRDQRLRPVALAHPDRRAQLVLELTLDHGSIATSGNSERGITVDGQRRGHILDPRHGSPCPDFGSLSVWSSSAARADALATGLYVLGPDAALARAEALPGVEAIVLERTPEGLRARTTSGLQSRIRRLDPTLHISSTSASPTESRRTSQPEETP